MTKQNFNIFKIYFTTPLHLGDNKADYGISLKNIHSDTMHAALLSALAKTGFNVPDGGNPGFDISDLFPFYENPEDDFTSYFFPKPVNQLIPPAELSSHAKKIKAVKWIDLHYFEKIINGSFIFDSTFNLEHLHGEYLCRKNIPEDFISSGVSPRVTVPRSGILNGIKQNARPFYMDRLYFAPRSGLYFLARGNLDILNKGLNILKHEGLGTDRNVGNGFFEIDNTDISINMSDSNYVLNLSMFVPESTEQKKQLIADKTDQKIAYQFAERGGWITTIPYQTLRKNSVFMFLPGSVLKTAKISSSGILGAIINLTPDAANIHLDHQIYRNGRSIMIPVKV